MALDSSAKLEQTFNYDRTREQRIIEALRHAQRGAPLAIEIINDLIAIITAVDDYAKGVSTAMDLIRTNYTTMNAKPKNLKAGT